MIAPWDPDFALRAPMFAPLQAVAQLLQGPAWPDCAALNAIAAARATPIMTAGGHALAFVPQAVRQPAFEDKYEPRIFLRGEVQMRERNWHDLFNALVWLTFPRAKAALNRRHYEALCVQRAAGRPNRGSSQDALTLFDEGGVIVATTTPALAGLLRGHEWKTLFWQRRAELNGAMAFYLFGHALYEKSLQPFAGVTGRGVIFAVDGTFFERDPGGRMEELDAQLAELAGNPQCFRTTRELAVVPILGVPGWCADNAHEAYYDDTDYFRPPPVSSSDRR
jgi:hypothetical protein